MKKKFFLVFSLLALFLISCDKDSITETILGENSIEITGDVTNSFDSNTMLGLVVEDSISVFTIMMQPKDAGLTFENSVVLVKEAATLPDVGKYDVDVNDTNPNSFHATYNVNDSTIYLMTSGSVEITTSSSSKVEGNFEMSGPLFDFSNQGTKTVTVKGRFTSVPMSL